MHIEQFDIAQTLPVIQFDYEQLKTWAQELVSKYDGLVVTEDQIPEIKKDMAELNKMKDKLNRARIDTVKAISAPIKEFEQKIKDICEIFTKAYTGLNNQVLAFQEEERKEKQSKILALINEKISSITKDNPEIQDKITVHIPANWLNKTCSMKTIEENIELQIQACVDAVNEGKRIKKAQFERLLLIENAVKGVNEKYGINISVSQFMGIRDFTDIEKDAAEILESIENAAREIASIKKGQDLQEVNPVQNNLVTQAEEKHLAEFQDDSKPPQDKITIRFTALFPPEQEDQVREILNQNGFMRIKRQLESIGVKTSFEKVSSNG